MIAVMVGQAEKDHLACKGDWGNLEWKELKFQHEVTAWFFQNID
jgi:hypothetical protein